MIINGEGFYDSESHGRVIFGLPQVVMLELHEVVMEFTNLETGDVQNETYWLCGVTLQGFRHVMTKPSTDQEKVAAIAHKLADMLNKWHETHSTGMKGFWFGEN